jgi:hypothetical protein
MADGFAVDLTALVEASSTVDVTVRVLAQQSVTDLNPGGGAIGHAHLTDRLANFCERWDIGIGHLGSDGRAIADRLRASAQAYERADHAAAGRFAGIGPDPAAR